MMNRMLCLNDRLVPRLIVVPLSSHEIDGFGLMTMMMTHRKLSNIMLRLVQHACETWKVDRVFANHYLSSTASLKELPTFPFISF